MYNVLILWAPDSIENKKNVDVVFHAFEPMKIIPAVKTAAESTIADVNNAHIVVFGSQKNGASDVPPEYAEYLRIFKGITLAGRTAGFFSLGTEKATARLRKALKDTEIAQFDDEPVVTDPKQSAEIADWVRRLVTFHKEMQNARA
jgi:hypothetical protein